MLNGRILRLEIGIARRLALGHPQWAAGVPLPPAHTSPQSRPHGVVAGAHGCLPACAASDRAGIRIPDHLLALPGYALILWSLAFLGPRFGVAPADRGLVTGGPYACLRHPMYLGELLLRTAFVFTAQDRFLALLATAALVIIQVERIRREEDIIAGYAQYQEKVRWRLLPYVW